MNMLASPGPDGFGPGFYRKYWPILKQKITDLFHCFYNQSADISCLNRAFIVLLPKAQGSTSPNAFRPISLQSCPIKAIAKLLTNRLKPVMLLLVLQDQTGFLSGRTISENFLYAADVLHMCARRKALVCWPSLQNM